MYKNLKILDPQAHSFYRYTPAKDYYYAKHLNLIPVTFSEVKYVCCDYPVVIIVQEGKPQLMLMTGVETNGALDEKGQWKSSYVPAFVRRYPFSLLRAEKEESVHIGFDLESGLFSSPEGYPLFQEDGAATEVLESVKTLLTAFWEESSITKNILMRMQEKALLQPSHFVLKNEKGEERKIDGFYLIDKTALLAQEDGFLLEAAKNGWMELIELQHLSLSKTEKIAL